MNADRECVALRILSVFGRLAQTGDNGKNVHGGDDAKRSLTGQIDHDDTVNVRVDHGSGQFADWRRGPNEHRIFRHEIRDTKARVHILFGDLPRAMGLRIRRAMQVMIRFASFDRMHEVGRGKDADASTLVIHDGRAGNAGTVEQAGCSLQGHFAPDHQDVP